MDTPLQMPIAATAIWFHNFHRIHIGTDETSGWCRSPSPSRINRYSTFFIAAIVTSPTNAILPLCRFPGGVLSIMMEHALYLKSQAERR